MSELYQNKYRVRSARLPGWDYGSDAAYFITICVAERRHEFGCIENDRLVPTGLGEIADTLWLEIPARFPYAQLDEFVIMPNHMHGILVIDKSSLEDDGPGDPLENVQTVETRFIASPANPGGITGKVNPMLHENIARILRWYKGRCTFEMRKINPYPDKAVSILHAGRWWWGWGSVAHYNTVAYVSENLVDEKQVDEMGVGVPQLSMIRQIERICKQSPDYMPRYHDLDVYYAICESIDVLMAMQGELMSELEKVNNALIGAKDDALHISLDYYYVLKRVAKSGMPGLQKQYREVRDNFIHEVGVSIEKAHPEEGNSEEGAPNVLHVKKVFKKRSKKA